MQCDRSCREEENRLDGDFGGPLYKLTCVSIFELWDLNEASVEGSNEPSRIAHFARLDAVWRWIEVKRFCIESQRCDAGDLSEEFVLYGDVLFSAEHAFD